MAETPYLWLINDLVESRNSNGTVLFHPYLRLIAPPYATMAPNVVVLATVQVNEVESIVLIEQERHATGTIELELPRGFGRPGISPKVQALRELQEETRYEGMRPECLGKTLIDSGTTDRSVLFVHVPVETHGDAIPEPQEAVAPLVLLPRKELWARIDSGVLRYAFTVQALSLYERRLRTSGRSYTSSY